MESIIDKSLQNSKFVFDDELIVNRSYVSGFLQELICDICNNVLKNPIECKTCEKPLCSDCKTNWFQRNPNTCPYCRNQSQFDRVNRMTRNLLTKIEFKCCYHEKGCKVVLPYDQLFAHQDKCSTIVFSCDKCSYKGVIGSP